VLVEQREFKASSAILRRLRTRLAYANLARPARPERLPVPGDSPATAPAIEEIQVADVGGRWEPGTGEINLVHPH
jgi:hypothetical protein